MPKAVAKPKKPKPHRSNAELDIKGDERKMAEGQIAASDETSAQRENEGIGFAPPPKRKPKPVEATPAESDLYHCTKCLEGVVRGYNCHTCGATLDWSGIS